MKKFTILLLVMLFSSLLNGCGSKQPPIAEESSIPVEVMKLAKTEMKMNYSTSGQISSSSETTVAPKVSGRVAAVKVKLGAQVKKGQVLFQIDSKEASNQLTEAEASLGIAKTSYDMADQALRDAQADYDRKQTLFESNVISTYDLEQANTALVNAKLNLEQARQQMNQTNATLSSAQENLADYSVAAPMDGLVGEINIESGEMVSSQTNAAVIVSIDTVKVEASIPESIVNELRPGSVVSVTIDSLNKSVEGTLTTIAPKADSDTMGYPVEISVANPSGEIKPGMTAKIELITGNLKNIFALPVDAVIEQDGQHIVYIVENNQAKEVSVKTGVTNDTLIEITDGLKEGQSIIVEGNRLLSDGQQVRVVKTQDGDAK
ncbi:RND family efflux transporter, MFP subunit [Desulfotomaculum arcticum]|uniref:RND family efflux transporter, MFP subunit n=1 Tax=Desulfotruncus arcticus DSM 17038 TaxID=1121424 RepID=A0A1I2XQP7_9FIRM|nr:RND family efflux transporter, MFP subunit [Desulfotomaculum arcticum] [Desulfotruncus arcticus DSM 17038]